MNTKELETLDPLHYSPVDVNGGLFIPPFRVFHYCLAHIEGEVVVLAPHCQFSDLLPIGCLIVVGDTVVSSTNLTNSIEDQCGRCVVTYPHHLGVASQEVQVPDSEGGV